ncbi:sodium:sulfate symporter [Haematococcus lacustris]|uniref:Sodium:sulfate symporter n=1 Tax=Haematococcus lacustris TaxID=44745 RepID=A0A6A0AB68_HAELA|nr:sodium:sulfate symporter [Haematococcus lacustris]
MAGLTNDAIWLIVISFFFAKASGSAFYRQPGGAYAFEKTGLGQRIANMMVAAVGHSTLGLAYSLAAAEVLLAPAMPSCTARAGGIFMPGLAYSLAAAEVLLAPAMPSCTARAGGIFMPPVDSHTVGLWAGVSAGQ